MYCLLGGVNQRRICSNHIGKTTFLYIIKKNILSRNWTYKAVWCTFRQSLIPLLSVPDLLNYNKIESKRNKDPYNKFNTKKNKIRINLNKKGKGINISTRATAFGFQPEEISHPNSVAHAWQREKSVKVKFLDSAHVRTTGECAGAGLHALFCATWNILAKYWYTMVDSVLSLVFFCWTLLLLNSFAYIDSKFSIVLSLLEWLISQWLIMSEPCFSL